MRVLVVDDLRAFVFPDGWTVDYARSLSDAVYLLSNRTYDAVYLDHDMGVEEVRHLVTWLQARYEDGRPIEVGAFYLQTSNVVEKRVIPLTLQRCGYKVCRGLGKAQPDAAETAARGRALEEFEAAVFPYGRQPK